MARRGSPLTVAVGKRIAAARVAAGYETMRDFAAVLKVTEQRYRRWEAGEVQAPYEILAGIADATGKSCDFLLRNVADMPVTRAIPFKTKAG